MKDNKTKMHDLVNSALDVLENLVDSWAEHPSISYKYEQMLGAHEVCDAMRPSMGSKSSERFRMLSAKAFGAAKTEFGGWV